MKTEKPGEKKPTTHTPVQCRDCRQGYTAERWTDEDGGLHGAAHPDHIELCPLHAAAPELLAALINAVKVLERKAPDSLDLIEARAAIAKAEGK